LGIGIVLFCHINHGDQPSVEQVFYSSIVSYIVNKA
jgi:hypothetical protein